ncbi:MAG: hypothetical protein PHR20_07575, partial [Bacteroidales bacterium]|nr:hypothetical protein [Bacteroidales bacterium]
MKTIKIFCENTKEEREYPVGTDLHYIAGDLKININNGILGAYVNNKPREMDFCLISPANIKFFGLDCSDGQ